MNRSSPVLLAAALAACSSGSSTPKTLARTSQGMIAARDTSTITVDGTVVDDSTARVTIDGAPKTKDDLQIGHVVTVRTDDKGKATDVRAHADLRGKVDDKGTSTVTVGTLVVHVDAATRFDDSASRLASIATGNGVRVSGFPDDKGGLRATRIEKDASATGEFEVRGTASAVTAAGFTLTVAPGAAPFTVTLQGGVTLPAGLVNGSFVEVKTATQPTAGAIVASSVKLDDDDKLGDADQEVEVEGIVTSGTSASFVIDGRTVTTSGTTKWMGGAPGDLAVGVKVEAEGKLTAAGAIAASKVSLGDSVKLQGAAANVTRIDPINGSFTMFNGFILVHVSNATELESGVNLDTLGSLSIEVRGYPAPASGSADLVATRIRTASGGGGSRIFIQGPVTLADANAKMLNIRGIAVDVSGATLKGRDETTVVPGDFFANVSAGMVVKARGPSAAALVGNLLKADEVELEDDK
jgi:uncharacterized protein DUF5666